LILDNVSGIQQVNPLIPPSSWLLIVTSTKPVLISRMVTIALEPMEILEAHTLLTRWAPEISPSIKEISLICQCIPLALEIIGKLLPSTPPWLLITLPKNSRRPGKASEEKKKKAI
jgi:hypothetical protein